MSISAEETIRPGQLSWLGHVCRMEEGRAREKSFQNERMEGGKGTTATTLDGKEKEIWKSTPIELLL